MSDLFVGQLVRLNVSRTNPYVGVVCEIVEIRTKGTLRYDVKVPGHHKLVIKLPKYLIAPLPPLELLGRAADG